MIQYNTSACPTTIESNGFINVSKESYSYNISELHAGLNYTISVGAGNPAGISDLVSVMGYTLLAGEIHLLCFDALKYIT